MYHFNFLFSEIGHYMISMNELNVVSQKYFHTTTCGLFQKIKIKMRQNIEKTKNEHFPIYD